MVLCATINPSTIEDLEDQKLFLILQEESQTKNLLSIQIDKYKKSWVPLMSVYTYKAHVFEEINQYYSTYQSLQFLCLSWGKV